MEHADQHANIECAFRVHNHLEIRRTVEENSQLF